MRYIRIEDLQEFMKEGHDPDNGRMIYFDVEKGTLVDRRGNRDLSVSGYRICHELGLCNRQELKEL